MKLRAKVCYLICGANITIALLGAIGHLLPATMIGLVVGFVYWNLAECYSQLPITDDTKGA